MLESKEPTAPINPSAEEGIADLVRRALIQTADMQTLEERLKEISKRSSKITPPPAEP
jgi:hypothetical protein